MDPMLIGERLIPQGAVVCRFKVRCSYGKKGKLRHVITNVSDTPYSIEMCLYHIWFDHYIIHTKGETGTFIK